MQPSSFLPFCFLQLRKSVLPTLGSEWTAATLASQPRSAQVGSAASAHTPLVSPGASTTARSRKVTSRTRHCPCVPTDALQLQSRTSSPLLPSGGSECPGHEWEEVVKPKEDRLLAQSGGVHGPPEPGTCRQQGSGVSTSPQLTPGKRCSYQTHIYVITGGTRLHLEMWKAPYRNFRSLPSISVTGLAAHLVQVTNTPGCSQHTPWSILHLEQFPIIQFYWIIARKHM